MKKKRKFSVNLNNLKNNKKIHLKLKENTLKV